MSLIDVKNLTFAYDGSYDTIFEKISVQLDTDWKLGFVGRNGRGKTTFLRLLMGEYAYSGSIAASVSFGYFPTPISNPAKEVGVLLQELLPHCARWEIQRELGLLQLPESLWERPFASLSGGEQTKVQLAALFLREDCFLLIDEPTNHLDALGRQVVAAYLRGKKGFLLVSHDRAFLDDCVEYILAIQKTGFVLQRGNFSAWWRENEARQAGEQEQNRQLKKEIARLEQAAQQTAAWSDAVEKTKYATKNSGLRPDRGFVGHKAAKMMKRAKSSENRKLAAAQEKSTLLQDVETADSLKLHPLRYHSDRLLYLEEAQVLYQGVPANAPTSFSLHRGERLVLAGGNGSGKSSLLKLLCGHELAHTGTVQVGSGLIISHLPQDTGFLQGNLLKYAEEEGLDITLFLAILRKLDFARVQFEKPLESLSAGQKKKVLLAASLCTPAHLYVWDEPLNYIDLLSRIQLEELLCKYQPTLLLVEHDRTFCQKVATRTVQL